MKWCGLILAGLLISGQASAEEYGRFELGVGPGWARIPHYRGSDQETTYVIPLPYIRYHGKRLRVDREGGRFYFVEKDIFKLDLSASFAPPVDSSDNRTREGMDSLDFIFELGPRVQLDFYESGDEFFKFRAAFPLRAAIATNGNRTENIGYIFSPYLQFRINYGLESSFSIGPMWASEEYHDYFYEVRPDQARLGRPAYNARAGYSGSRITITSSYRWRDYWFGIFLRYDKLNGAVFMDSPLIKQDDSLMVGLAITWVFKSVQH